MRTRILVVDDEPSVRETLIANLELDDRFEVLGAESGAAALALVEKEPFDVVLSDVRMPGMNGVELFRLLTQARPGMPVVLMTAFALEGLVQEAVHEGVFTVLAKPSPIDTVVHTVAQAARRPFVLVVDDEASLAFATVEALRSAGIRAAAAYDGEGAVHAVSHGAVDVCVLDMAMRGLGTEEVVQRIREQDHAIAVVAVLSDGAAAALLRLAARLDGMLQKPVDLRQLIEAIARVRHADSVTRQHARTAVA